VVKMASPFSKIPYRSFGDVLSGAANIVDRKRSEAARLDFLNKKFDNDQAAAQLRNAFEAEKIQNQRDYRDEMLKVARDKLEIDRKKAEGGGAGEFGGPFQGKSSWAQEGNVLFNQYTESGMSPVQAQKATIDKLRETRTRMMRTFDDKGDTIYQEAPGVPLFKEAKPRTFEPTVKGIRVQQEREAEADKHRRTQITVQEA